MLATLSHELHSSFLLQIRKITFDKNIRSLRSLDQMLLLIALNGVINGPCRSTEVGRKIYFGPKGYFCRDIKVLYLLLKFVINKFLWPVS